MEGIDDSLNEQLTDETNVRDLNKDLNSEHLVNNGEDRNVENEVQIKRSNEQLADETNNEDSAKNKMKSCKVKLMVDSSVDDMQPLLLKRKIGKIDRAPTNKRKKLVKSSNETAKEVYDNVEWPIEPVAKMQLNGQTYVLHKWNNEILTATEAKHVQLDPSTALPYYDPEKHGPYKTQWDVKMETEKQVKLRNIQIRGNQFYICPYCECRSGDLGLRKNTINHMLSCKQGATMKSVLFDIDKGKVSEMMFRGAETIKRGRRRDVQN